MWKELKRVTKDNGAIVLFGSEPFSSKLRMSNLKMYRYDWVWEKTNKTGFQLANKRPLKQHENILIFYNKQSIYNPQNLKFYGKINKRGSTGDNWSELKEKQYIQKFTNYPTDILEYTHDKPPVHPTQKPVDLLEYLIKTYTNPGETILDFTMGSGSTLVAAKKTGRNCIGIEQEDKYCKIAVDRLKNTSIK